MRNAVQVLAVVVGLVSLFLAGCGQIDGIRGGLSGSYRRSNSPAVGTNNPNPIRPVSFPKGPFASVLSQAAQNKFKSQRPDFNLGLICIDYPGMLARGRQIKVFAKECSKVQTETGLILFVTDSELIEGEARRPNVNNPYVTRHTLSYRDEAGHVIDAMILKETVVHSSRASTLDQFGRNGTRKLKPEVTLEIEEFCTSRALPCNFEFDAQGNLSKIK